MNAFPPPLPDARPACWDSVFVDYMEEVSEWDEQGDEPCSLLDWVRDAIAAMHDDGINEGWQARYLADLLDVRDYLVEAQPKCVDADDECFGPVTNHTCSRHQPDTYSPWPDDPSVTGHRTSDEWGVS